MKIQSLFFKLGSTSLVCASLFCAAAALAQSSKTPPLSSKQEASSPPGAQEELRLELVIPSDTSSNKTVVFKVPQHASVNLQVKSERAGELHIHAYRLSLALKDQDTQSLKFKAKASGKFNIEWHPKLPTSKPPDNAPHAHAHTHAAPLASLEVQPL